MARNWGRRYGAFALISVAASFVPEVTAGALDARQFGAGGIGGGVGPQSPPPTGTGTGTGATTTSTATVVFAPLATLQTCVEHLITWNYTGTSQQFRVTVTNNGVPQVPPDSSSVVGSIGKRGAVSQVVFSQPANIESYAWTVNVPQGYYLFDGQLQTGQTPTSQPFFVANGTDTSCLATSSPTTSPTTSPTSTGTSRTGTTTPPKTASKTATSSTSSNTGVLSASGGSSKSHNTGAIAGGIVAAVVVIAAALGATYYLCRVAPARKRAQLAGGEKRHWGGLSDPKSPTTGQARTAPAVVGVRGAGGPTHTPGSSHEDFDKEYASAVRSAPGALDASAMAMPLAYDSRSTFTPSVIAPSPIRTKLASSRAPSSRTSIDTASSQQPSPLRASRSRNGAYGSSGAVGVQSMPERTAPRSSLDTGRHGTESIPMARTGSTQRPARKPVPQYDATEMASASAPSRTGLSGSPSTAEFGVQNPFDTQPSSPATTSNSHGQTSPIAAAARANEGNELLRKASFPEVNAGRQVHYLIPDMPQPQR